MCWFLCLCNSSHNATDNKQIPADALSPVAKLWLGLFSALKNQKQRNQQGASKSSSFKSVLIKAKQILHLEQLSQVKTQWHAAGTSHNCFVGIPPAQRQENWQKVLAKGFCSLRPCATRLLVHHPEKTHCSDLFRQLSPDDYVEAKQRQFQHHRGKGL